jgi:hypothetical protein
MTHGWELLNRQNESFSVTRFLSLREDQNNLLKDDDRLIEQLTAQISEYEQSLNESIKQIIFTVNNGPTAQIRQIQDMISQLVYKPNIKGSVGEMVLADIWPQFYRFDLVERLGGSGREDYIITPYLNSGVSCHGDGISVERKTGKQKYSGTHFDDAVKHALARGLSYCIIVYDTEDNVPEKAVIVRENGVLVAVTDLHSGTWQMLNVSSMIMGI